MGLADQMRPLAKQIAADHDQRVAALPQLRAATARELSESNAARRKMAREYRRAADESLERRHSDVATLRADCRAAHRAVAAKQRKQLSTQMKTLRKGVAEFLTETHEAHVAMAAEQAGRRAEQREELRSMTAEQAGRRAKQREELQEETAATLKEFTTDRAEGRRVWLSIDSLKRGGQAKPKGTPARAAAYEPGHERGGNGKPDDLTVIHGLGPTMQRRLNAAGIKTLAQLAGSSAARLRKALGDAGRRAKVEDWIAEAHDLRR